MLFSFPKTILREDQDQMIRCEDRMKGSLDQVEESDDQMPKSGSGDQMTDIICPNQDQMIG